MLGWEREGFDVGGLVPVRGWGGVAMFFVLRPSALQ